MEFDELTKEERAAVKELEKLSKKIQGETEELDYVFNLKI